LLVSLSGEGDSVVQAHAKTLIPGPLCHVLGEVGTSLRNGISSSNPAKPPGRAAGPLAIERRGTGVTFDAIESLCRQWVSRIGAGLTEGMTREKPIAWVQAKTMLQRLTSLGSVAG
jgi:hypothetical protein